MRPILAILGAAILVAVALTSYFVPSGFSESARIWNTQSEMVEPTSGYTFLPTVPVSLTVTQLPPRAAVWVVPCPVGASTALQCTSDGPAFLVAYNYSASSGLPLTVTLHFEVNVGHAFLVLTNASQGAGTSFQASSPIWAEYTWFITALLVAGVVLVAVGLHHEPKRAASPSYYVDQSGYAAGPAPKRFCEVCGNPFSDDATTYCTSCGAPRS